MNYEEYIRSPQWRNKRLAALKGVKGCQSCGRSALLEVHHTTYKRLGHERPSDLIALCDICHTGIHQLHRTRGGTIADVTDQVVNSTFVREDLDPATPFIPRNIREPRDWRDECRKLPRGT